jgi:hypothetical protein
MMKVRMTLKMMTFKYLMRLVMDITRMERIKIENRIILRVL